MVDQTTMGIGPALRRARERRGVSLGEAARDSRLPAGHLEALEDEDFRPFGGEVFARAALGSYARYLGLDSGKVLGFYDHHVDAPEPPPPPARLGRVERALAAARIRDNQRFLLIAASMLIVVLIVFGLLSRDRVAPDAGAISTTTEAALAGEGTIEVVLEALRPVDVAVSVDGQPTERFEMRTGETRALLGTVSVDVTVADGTAVRLHVNGDRRGIPGEPGLPWAETFTTTEEGAVSPTG